MIAEYDIQLDSIGQAEDMYPQWSYRSILLSIGFALLGYTRSGNGLSFLALAHAFERHI